MQEDTKPRTRRRHDDEFKQRILSECAAPGASVAKVALANGLNANLVHKWRRDFEAPPLQQSSPVFIPVTVAPPTMPAEPTCIDLELQRGATTVRVRWPSTASSSCAAWLREILR
ncbi:IS66-like element accessory protein TnpA [Rubrivivax gelatinosus]|uniref:Transposase n=1 Tax=Rubrivivax gelatinosus TaxID=28068 RepID=A0ABS1E023_RUBGE|nr:transposase [Rubrivivax gelatinosus]MBK1715270.1 hypothetical protein [Rubrivivax gelatinosus]